MVTKLYRFIFPEELRQSFYSLFLGKILRFKRNFNILYKAFLAYRFNFYKNTEIYDTLNFIGKYGLRSCPGEFSLKYDNLAIEVQRDTHPFIIHKGKKLYFPESFSNQQVQKLYKSLITEQDSESAHKYSLDEFDYKDAILFDIGAAEGILSLEKMDVIQFAYLVECEERWVSALQKTFEPYNSKVKIIFKYIDQYDGENAISLNTLGKDLKGKKVFVKMDIEGFEEKTILGGKEFLLNNHCTTAICTYHNPNHPKEIGQILKNLGYKSNFSKGYIYWGYRLSKALIRSKNYN